MHRARQVLSYRQRAVTVIGSHVQVVKQHRLRSILGKHRAQDTASLIHILIIQRQEHPLVRRDGLRGGVGLVANLHHEVIRSIRTHLKLLFAVAVTQNRAGACVVHPQVSREVLLRKVDAGFRAGSALGVLSGKGNAMSNSLSVQGGSNLEVVRLGEQVLANVLVEGHADFVAVVQHTVARVGIAKELWTRHVLHDVDYIAIDVNRLVTVHRCRLHAEPIVTVHLVLHVVVEDGLTGL